MIVHHAGESASKELTLDVTFDAPRSAVWRCWTEAELLRQWYCPKPWRVPEADLDVRCGGRFNTVFAGPNGESVENKGAFLDVEAMTRLVFTDGYTEGFVPAEKHFMTGYVELSDAPDGKTRMNWGARHANDEDTKKHLDMGFCDGWKAAAAQLEELAKSIG
jgi:uncharacterized protein YndB with AHSA1/START domain